jgi:hypothetical protein
MECSGGRFSNSKGVAINLDGARIHGSVLFDKKFEAMGAVRLNGITVDANLECQEARFINEGQDALFAPLANIGGNVVLCNDFLARGKVTLYAAKIRGSLVCNACQFLHEGQDALFAAAAEIGDYAFLNGGFVAKGSVNLEAVTIGNDLNCIGGHFSNPNKIALTAQMAKISGNTLMSEGFTVDGVLNFSHAEVSGALIIFDVSFKESVLSLVSATVTTLQQSSDGWPKEGRLFLNGFTYDSLGIKFPRKHGVEWMRLQPKEFFSLQPYEQLANVLKSSGYESEATEVLIAKQDDLRRYGDLKSGAKLWNFLLGLSIGHGYKPHRAFLFMMYFVWLGAALFHDGYRNHLITPSNQAKSERDAMSNYPKFQPFVYSLDCFLPTIDLKQKSAWSPNANKGYEIVIPTIGLKVRWEVCSGFTYASTHCLDGR